MRYADSNGFSAVLIPPILPVFSLRTILSTPRQETDEEFGENVRDNNCDCRKQEIDDQRDSGGCCRPARLLVTTAVPLFTNRTTINGSHKGTCSGASMDGSSEGALHRQRPNRSSAQPYGKSRSRGRPLQVPSSSCNRIQRS